MPELEKIDFPRTQPSGGEYEGDLNFDPDPYFGPYLN